jgi:hypothetical protein
MLIRIVLPVRIRIRFQTSQINAAQCCFSLWQNLTQEEPAGCGERFLPPDRHRRRDGVPPLRPEGVIAVDPGEDAQEGEMAPPDDGVAQKVDAVVLAGAEPLASASR